MNNKSTDTSRNELPPTLHTAKSSTKKAQIVFMIEDGPYQLVPGLATAISALNAESGGHNLETVSGGTTLALVPYLFRNGKLTRLDPNCGLSISSRGVVLNPFDGFFYFEDAEV